MHVNLVSESEFFTKDHGVHTAYITTAAMIRKKGMQVSINSLRPADITHIHTIGPFGLYKLKTSKHTVVSAHVVPDSFVGSLKGTQYWLGSAKTYLRYFYNTADLVLAVAPRVKDQLVALGVKSRIEIMPNPVNNTIFKEDAGLRKKGREILGIDRRKFVFISVGQIQPRKGVGDFIRLAKQFPEALFIWIGGKPFKSLTADDMDMNHLLANPPANFFIKGPFFYDTMPAVLNAADAFLFPSYQENAPMSPLEGAACGLPLLLRDLPEYKMLYKSGYTGCEDIPMFHKMMKRMIVDEKFYNKMRKESKELAEKYSIDILGNTLIRYYNSLVT